MQKGKSSQSAKMKKDTLQVKIAATVTVEKKKLTYIYYREFANTNEIKARKYS